MIVVGDGDMSAAFPVGVIVSRMLGVALGGALVEVPVVGGVEMPVVDVVDMVAVGDGDMSAAVTVDVGCGRRARGGWWSWLFLLGVSDGVADDVADVGVGQLVGDLGTAPGGGDQAGFA